MSEDKKILRKQMKLILKEMSEQERNIQSQQICKFILQSAAYAECDMLFSYMALWDEVKLDSVNEKAFLEKNLCLPRVISAEYGVMDFFCVGGDRPLRSDLKMNRGDRPLSQYLESGSYNIKEPDRKKGEKIDFQQISGKKILCLVPGVAFTKDCNRLGRGKGFYDRFLEKMKQLSFENKYSIKTIGISFKEQLVDYLPTEKNDIKLNGIITSGQFFESAE